MKKKCLPYRPQFIERKKSVVQSTSWNICLVLGNRCHAISVLASKTAKWRGVKSPPPLIVGKDSFFLSMIWAICTFPTAAAKQNAVLPLKSCNSKSWGCINFSSSSTKWRWLAPTAMWRTVAQPFVMADVSSSQSCSKILLASFQSPFSAALWRGTHWLRYLPLASSATSSFVQRKSLHWTLDRMKTFNNDGIENIQIYNEFKT